MLSVPNLHPTACYIFTRSFQEGRAVHGFYLMPLECHYGFWKVKKNTAQESLKYFLLFSLWTQKQKWLNFAAGTESSTPMQSIVMSKAVIVMSAPCLVHTNYKTFCLSNSQQF